MIAVILNLYAKGKCRESECKEGINNLTRAYGRQFCHKKPSRISVEADRAAYGARCPKDHVVPIKHLMAHLMGEAKASGRINAKQIIAFLDTHSITCKITESEDQKLRTAKLWDKMPASSICPHTGRILNIWARYEHPDVEIELLP